jgi:hypothetical protein
MPILDGNDPRAEKNSRLGKWCLVLESDNVRAGEERRIERLKNVRLNGGFHKRDSRGLHHDVKSTRQARLKLRQIGSRDQR